MKIRFLYLILSLPLISAVSKYGFYIYQSTNFPFDWEPTDGDHLNFAMRLAAHQPIYFTSESGHLLSVYNPLYHFLISVLSGGTPSFFVARAVSSGLWILVLVIVISGVKIRRINLYSLIILNLLVFPPVQGMILDTVQIGPSSLLGLMFLVTGLTFDKIDRAMNNRVFLLYVAGVLAGLTFFSKQQGMIVAIAGILFLILKIRLKRYVLIFATAALVTLFIGITLIDSIKGNTFLRSTVIDLNGQIPGYWKLGARRLAEFALINSGILAVVLLGIKKVNLNIKNLTFWHISFFTHIPFLFYILRNGGGGPNYFLTFWITLIMILIDSDQLLDFTEYWKKFSRRESKLETNFTNKVYLIAVPLVILTSVYGSFINFKILNNIYFPQKIHVSNSNALQKFAQNHVVSGSCSILTARNSGVFLSSKCDIDSENVITFQYAWNVDKKINKEIIKDRIKSKQYDLISTGVGTYPPEILKLIEDNYVLGIEKEINFNYGQIGRMRVYIPERELHRK